MPQDTVWTGQYQKIIEQANNDTSVKYINIKMDTSAVDRIFSQAGLKNTSSPFPIFILLLFIIIAVLVYKMKKRTDSIKNVLKLKKLDSINKINTTL